LKNRAAHCEKIFSPKHTLNKKGKMFNILKISRLYPGRAVAGYRRSLVNFVFLPGL
jgi:hypothetical protein